MQNVNSSVLGRYSIALSKHKEKLNNLTSAINKVRAEIDFKKEEIVKLQTEQVTANTQIEKTQKQLKSLTELMDNFSVIFFIFLRAIFL